MTQDEICYTGALTIRDIRQLRSKIVTQLAEYAG